MNAPPKVLELGSRLSFISNDDDDANSEPEPEALRIRRSLYQHLSDTSHNLTFFTRHVYCFPQFATLPVVTLLAVYAVTYYESLGASLSTISFFIALGRSIDVIVDPLMSHYTDSFRSRFGRRKPFCFVGCWIYALMLNLLLSPPSSLQSAGVSVWFGLTYIGFFLANTFMTIPYDALGPELTDNYEDRSKLFFTAGMYDGIGALIAIVLPGLIGATLNLSGYSCSNDSCINTSSGYGESCLAVPATGKTTSYYLFNPLHWYWNTSSPSASAFSSTDTFTCKHFLGNTYAHPSDLFTPSQCSLTSSNQSFASIPQCMQNYCNCIDECISLCQISSHRVAYTCVGVFFGVWIVAGMVFMVYWIKERSQLDSTQSTLVHKSPPIVASLLNTFRNRAFTSLLPAWAFEAVAFALIASMMTYFVRYVIEPEYQTSKLHGIDCNQGIPIAGEESDSWRCKSDIVLGGIVCCMLLGAFSACPVWLYLSKRFGKRDAWLGWSFSMSIVILLFLFIGKGDVSLALGFGFISGIPLGAKFLSDAILADIIDYDEFLTGMRNEATYTMFKSFLPKICAIPASAVPIAILSSIGLKEPVGGRIQEQSSNIKLFCICITVVVPSILSFISFLAKLQFPLRTKEQVQLIAIGVGKHLQGFASDDPVSGKSFRLSIFTESERHKVYIFDNFPSLKDARELKVSQSIGRGDLTIKKFITRSRDHVIICFFSFICSCIFTAFSIPLLTNESLSILPTFAIIGLGMSLTFGGLSFSRLKASLELKNPENCPSGELLLRIIEFRKSIQVIDRSSRNINTYEEMIIFLTGRSRDAARLLSQNEDIDDNDDDDEDNNNDNDAGDGNQSSKKKTAKKKLTKEEKAAKLKTHVGTWSKETASTTSYRKSIGNRKVFDVSSDSSEIESDAHSSMRISSKRVKSAVPEEELTVWDVELYSFILDQERQNISNSMKEWEVTAPGDGETVAAAADFFEVSSDSDDDDDDFWNDDGRRDGDGDDDGNARREAEPLFPSDMDGIAKRRSFIR